MADWNNETDSIVIGKCVNANSEQPSGVNGTKQAGEQRQGNQYNNLQNWIGGGGGGSESGTNNHCDESIVEHSVAT